MAKFELIGAHKGKTVVLGQNQYAFTKGVLECSDEDGDKIQYVLETYYGAKRVVDEAAVKAAADAQAAADAEADAKAAAEKKAADELAATAEKAKGT